MKLSFEHGDMELQSDIYLCSSVSPCLKDKLTLIIDL